jgi:hypothetical protein
MSRIPVEGVLSMSRKAMMLGAAALVAVLVTTSQARAWGAAHVGYTHVGYGGVQHYGHTTAVGPYGAYSGSHYGSYGAGGAYHYGTGAGYHYGGYGGASYGGYHYGGTSTYGNYYYGGIGGPSIYGTPYASGVYRVY